MKTSIEWVCAAGKRGTRMCETRVVTHSYASDPEKRPPGVEHYCRGMVSSPLKPMRRVD